MNSGVETQKTPTREPNDRNRGETGSFLLDLRPTINFEYKTSKLAPEAWEELDSLAMIAKQNPDYELIVRGYADNVGSYKYNKRLSKLRADIVQGYLVERGIEPARIKSIGMGEVDPLVPNTTPEGRAVNRRVEIEFVPIND